MENRVVLKRYRLSLDRNDLPVQLHRTPTSVTYRAQEIETGREVTLERVTADIPSGDFREVLISEAAIAQQIHQLNVPALYDFGFDEGELVFVTEYLEGRTAAAWVAARGPLAPAAVLRVALQIVSAMSAMAFDRIYHHALNPENIIFLNWQTEAGDWPIKVLHWLGVAPLFTEVGDAELDYAARFTSPEQLYTGRADLRSEIYSLGCTMWFLLTGAPPSAPKPGIRFSVKFAAELDSVPKIVRDLILRMLHPEPDERPQDPMALNAILETCLERVEQKERSRDRVATPFVREIKELKRSRRIPIAPKTISLAALLIALALLGAVVLPRFVGAHNALLPRFESNKAAFASRNEMARPPKRTVAPMAAIQTRSETGSGSERKSRRRVLSSSKPSPGNEIASGKKTGPIVEVPTQSAGIVERGPAAAAEPPPPEEGPTNEVSAPVTLGAAESKLAKAAVSPHSINAEPKTRPVLTAKNESSAAAHFPNVAASGPAPLTNESGTSASATSVAEVDATNTNTLQTTPDDSSDSLSDEPGQKIAVGSQPPVAEEAGSVKGSPTPAVAEATPVSKRSHSSPAPAIKSRSTQKSKSAVVARKSSTKTESRKRLSPRQTEARRPRKFPQLYFGSSPAELVGTTRDGHWILSVKRTGKKFIVPPPPGFAKK